MGTSIPQRGPKRRVPQRAVSQSIRRSGKPLFFGWGAHLTHHEREQVKERIAAGIGIVIALAVIAILGGGAVYQYVVKPAQAAAAKQAKKAEQLKLDKKTYAIVGGVKIDRGWYEAEVKAEKGPLETKLSEAEQAGAQYESYVKEFNQEIGELPQSIYNYMIANLVIEQKAHALLGTKTTPADEAKWVRNLIKSQFHGSTADFDAEAKQSGMTPDQFQQYQLMQSYNFRQLTTALDKRVHTKATFVKVRHILIGLTKPTRASFATTKAYKAGMKSYQKQLTAAKAKAQKVLGLLEAAGNSNAAWKTLAAKYSTDTTSKTKGGLYSWTQSSTYVPVFRNASDTWPLDRDGIIHSQFGFHVLEVLGRRNQKLTQTQLQQNQEQTLNTWLTNLESKKGYVVRDYTPPAPTSTTTP